MRSITAITPLCLAAGMAAQTPAPKPKFDAFEVATLKLLIAAAYDVNPKTISGGPSWVSEDRYDSVAVGSFVSLLQCAVLDRPVVDNTKLADRYDFDLEWTPDETRFGGGIPTPTVATTRPSLFIAVQEQLGLKLEVLRGPVNTLVIDKVERPSEN